ncbi:MAG: hypothetical protein ACN6PY_01735, partial [Paraburkholderia nemoris]
MLIDRGRVFAHAPQFILGDKRFEIDTHGAQNRRLSRGIQFDSAARFDKIRLLVVAPFRPV